MEKSLNKKLGAARRALLQAMESGTIEDMEVIEARIDQIEDKIRECAT